MHCRIISSWFYDENGESWGAAIEQDYPGLGLSDLVNPQNVPPQLNIFIGESKAGGGLIEQIVADSNYSPGCILTSHETEASIPTIEKFNAIRKYLMQLGMTTEQANVSVGSEIQQRTLWEISQDLIAWLKAQ